MASMRGLEVNTNPSIAPSDTPSAPSDLLRNDSPPKQAYAPRTSSLPSTRSRAQSNASTSSLKRKPLPPTASAIATKISTSEHLVTKPDARLIGPPSVVTSPTLPSQVVSAPVPDIPDQFLGEQRNTSPGEGLPELDGLMIDAPPKRTEAGPPSTNPSHPNGDDQHSNSTGTSYKHERVPSEPVLNSASNPKARWLEDLTSSGLSRSATMSIFSNKPTPPRITLPPNVPVQNISNEANKYNKQPLPRSPGGSKLGSFFGWVGHNSASSSVASVSERELLSPTRSPTSPERHVPTKGSHPLQSSTNKMPQANVEEESYFDSAFPEQSQGRLPSKQQLDDMESELKTITQELATSIRREMELEDMVERLQAEAANPPGPGRRTSDYFSDSGTSSVKYASDSEASRTEEWERLQRTLEREKAQIKIDLTAKVQEERSRREELEVKISHLEGKGSGATRDVASSGDNGRLKDLEVTCEDLRRRLNEERQVKENFEDLLKAMKNELQASHNERDNLREEVVPQLRARVEGLEAQAAEHEKTAYENTRMQQDMRNLQNDNLTLTDAGKKFSTSDPEAHAIALRPSLPESPALSRSSSFQWGDSREALADRVKDVEAQRDALHQSLKSLLERQEHQTRETQKRIRQLEMERDRALTSAPKKPGYNHEVANLRDEINSLRRRADNAIEQKWHFEQGLSGMKMDLDRAEKEIGSLRTLLRESYISVSANRASRSGSVASESLERSYRELKKAYAMSVERINNLERSNREDQETEMAMAELHQSLAAVTKERDLARKESEDLQLTVGSFQSLENRPVITETGLADQLRNSAKRVEELTVQVRQQLASNATLRERLTETIKSQEKEQQETGARILVMQDKLQSLESALRAAQQTSEEQIAQHEEEIRVLQENHSAQLVRVKDGLLTPRLFSPKASMFPVFANGKRSPRLGKTFNLPSSPEDQTQYLKSRVVELERALEEADREMEEVVNKMNVAQIEVMELQNEREEAARQTKKLKTQIEEVKLSEFKGRFGTLKS